MTGITSKSKHIMEYPDSSSAARPIWHVEELPIPELQEIGLPATKSLILTKITDNKKGTILKAIRHMEQVVPQLNSFYLHKKILTTLTLIWPCLNNLNSQIPE